MSRATYYCPEYKKFAGAAHVISDDDTESVTLPSSQNTLQHTVSLRSRDSSSYTMGSMRESHVQTREVSASLEPPHKISRYGNLREEGRYVSRNPAHKFQLHSIKDITSPN